MVAGCAGRSRVATVPYPPPPVVFNDTPSLEELAAVVNRTDSITQLSSNSTTVEVLSMPRVPRLTNSTLHLQRERRFRLRASLPIVMGAGVDMGSNEELFWFEVPEGITLGKTLYYARHDQYQQQLNRAVLPVDPTWLIDALGLVHVDPGQVVAGPVRRDDGKLEIRSTLPMPDGVYQRVCFIEPSAGYVTDQLLYNPSGTLIAQSQATKHVYYEQSQCALPHQVDLTLSPIAGPPLSMRIEVGAYAVNQLLSTDPNLFAIPQSASRAIDLTTLSGGGAPTVGAPPPADSPAATPVEYNASVPMGYPLRGSIR
jgi:hypothetical protein